jgi:hypothetical protein
MNYTPEQIAEVRREFHTVHGSRNSPIEAQIDIEEEWFPVIFNAENPLQLLHPPAAPQVGIAVEERVPNTTVGFDSHSDF